jgi:uncharacterized protein YggU (UPF0235/DUF167 family)
VTDLEIRVTARSASNRVGPMRDGVLDVRVTRPPADGEANAAVLRLVADRLGVPASHVRLVAGERARRKRIRVEGLAADELERRLQRIGRD